VSDTEGAEVIGIEIVDKPNGAERAEIIAEACETIAEFERQIDGLKSEIKTIKETRVKGRLGMLIKDFDLAYKLFHSQREPDDGLFDTIREVFAALNPGGQSDWVSAAEHGEG